MAQHSAPGLDDRGELAQVLAAASNYMSAHGVKFGSGEGEVHPVDWLAGQAEMLGQPREQYDKDSRLGNRVLGLLSAARRGASESDSMYCARVGKAFRALVAEASEQ